MQIRSTHMQHHSKVTVKRNNTRAMTLFIIGGILIAGSIGGKVEAATLHQPIMSLSLSGNLQQDEGVTVQEALQICNRIKKARDRLDCFEGLASAASGQKSSNAAKRDDNSDRVASEEGSTNDQKDNERQASDADLKDDNDKNTAPPVKLAEPKDEDNAEEPRFVILSKEEADERLDKRTKKQKRQAYEATVRKVWTNGERKLFILLNNGEIWKQNETGSPRKPKVGDTVKLRPAGFGGWFVKLPRVSRSLRMRNINP